MELYYFLAVMVVSSILQGITGFGGALVAAPLLLLVFDKSVSVVSLTFVSITINALLLFTIKNKIDKKTFKDLLIPGLIGLPLGLLILQAFDITTLRIIVGLLSIIFAILLFSQTFPVESSRTKRMFAGLFSGILRTSIGLNSPPVVLLLAAENTDKDEMRKTLASFFLAISLISIPLFFFTNHFTPEVLTYSLYSIPAALLGGWIGSLISKKVSQKGFIWSVFILITISIIISVISAIHR